MELESLRRAVLEYPSSIEKQERWKNISQAVGTRGKRECYERYKELKEEKASYAQSKVADQAELDDLLECAFYEQERTPPDAKEVFTAEAKKTEIVALKSEVKTDAKASRAEATTECADSKSEPKSAITSTSGPICNGSRGSHRSETTSDERPVSSHPVVAFTAVTAGPAVLSKRSELDADSASKIQVLTLIQFAYHMIFR